MRSFGRDRPAGSVDDFQPADQLVDLGLLVSRRSIVGARDTLDHRDVLLPLDADGFVFQDMGDVVEDSCWIIFDADRINGTINQADGGFCMNGQDRSQLPLDDGALKNADRAAYLGNRDQKKRCGAIGAVNERRRLALKLIEPRRCDNLIKNQSGACEHQGGQCEPNQTGIPIH